MIKWYDNLYVDSVIRKKQEKVKSKIEKGKLSFHVYCIAFASNGNNLFDIIDTNELLFQYYKRKDIYILGLAAGKENAFELVTNMIEEIYCNTGDFQVRNYFKFDSD